MKAKIFAIIIALGFSLQVWGATPVTQDTVLSKIKPLRPLAIHHRSQQIISYLLAHTHYLHKPINDDLSSQMFDNYLEILDKNKMYFLQSDIEEFEKYRYRLDDFLKSGKVDAAFEIYNRFARRFGERYLYIARRLQKPFDFSIKENYLIDREDQPWARTPAQLDSIWRKSLKNEALNLKLSGKEESKLYATLRKRYHRIFKRVIQTESEDVFQWFMNALAQCYDPHTSYMSPKISADFKIRMSKSLEGIGATLRTEDDYTKVVDLVPGGPADKSGLLHPNDRIIGVGQGENGELVDVIGWRIDDVVQLIRGPKGTKVRLQIIPADAPAGTTPEVITIVRDKVKLSDRAAKSDTLDIDYQGKHYRFGVIDIPDFYLDYEAMRRGDPQYASTSEDVKKLLRQLMDAGVDGIIIDLRGNGGGFLSEAINLTGLFIPNGPVVQVRDSRKRIKVERNLYSDVVYDGPLLVLIDRFSASASEIFSAAIQDYKRGLVVGNQSFGKGTVQNIIRLSNFLHTSPDKVGQLKLTIAKFYRVTGGSTQNVGVIPDIELPSLLAGLEIGERSEKNALLWDQIAPVPFEPCKRQIEKVLPDLKKRYAFRLSTNPELRFLVEEARTLKKERERKWLPLELTERQQLKKAAEKIKERRKKLKEKMGFNKEDEIFINEAAHILADYIQLAQS